MSSKKARRRKRKQQEQERGGRKLNPATVFILSIAIAILLTVGSVIAFTDRSGPGQPPWPGAVWSPDHGHWH